MARLYLAMGTSKNEFGDIIPGVIQRTVEKIINSNRSNQYGFSFKMKLIEIYKNQFKDLLVADETYMRIGGNLALRNKMSMSASVEIENLDQVMATYGKAVSNLRTTGTKMNDFSSRSHLIIVIESNHPVRGTSKLFIVDLAGSERSFRVGGNSATLDEGNHINKDLTDLGIYAWQEWKAKSNINECDSGCFENSLLIACLNTNQSSENESLCTLKFVQEFYTFEKRKLFTFPFLNNTKPQVKSHLQKDEKKTN